MRDAEFLARKLKPLMPKDVERWLTARSIGDPETARLVDDQIARTAKQVFVDPDRHVLLSLPEQEAIKGPINLGTVVYGGDRWDAGLHLGEVLQSVAIFGRSGSGKTNAAIHILRQLDANGVPFLMFDSKRTLRHALGYFQNPVRVFTPGRDLLPFSFNPFVPPASMDPLAYAGQLVDVISDAYTLGDGSRRVLQKVLVPLYEGGKAPNLTTVLAAVEALPTLGRQGGWKVSALRALESMEFARLAGTIDPNAPNPLDALAKHSVVLELDALSQNARKLLVPLLCLHLYQRRLSVRARETLALVVVIEEAHQYLRGSGGSRTTKEPLVETLLRQWRELGIGTMIVDQHVSRISPVALGNACATLIFNLKDPQDVAKAASLAAVGEEEKRCFTRLPVGQAVVKLQERYRSAFLVRVPLVAIDKGAVTDEVLVRAGGVGGGGSKVLGSHSGHSGAETANGGGNGRIRDGDEALSADELAIIHDVMAHPDDGVGKRYRRLGLSGDRGHSARVRLVRKGWLEAQSVPVGQTRLLLLRATSKARRVLGIAPTEVPTRESIEHAYWKRRYAARYREMGYRVQIEAPYEYGRVDVLATKGDESIAIEIETGKSGHIVENVRNSARYLFDRIVVVATNTVALQACKYLLATAGLSMPSRLTIERARHAMSDEKHALRNK